MFFAYDGSGDGVANPMLADDGSSAEVADAETLEQKQRQKQK